MMKTVLWLTVIWIPVVLAWMLVNETKFKKNIAIGVTLPHEAREDGDVLSVIGTFKRHTVCCTALLLVLAALCWAFSTGGTLMTFWCLWITVCIVLPNIPYIFANKKLKELKAEKGWIREKRRILVDTSALAPVRRLSPLLFLPPVLLCLLPLLFEKGLAVLSLTSAVCCILFWFGYRWLYRDKAEMADGNTELTIVLSQIRRRSWGKMWLITAYAMSIYCAAVWISLRSAFLSILLFIAVTAILIVLVFRIEMRTRRLQETLTQESGRDWYVDEDDHWIFGLLYYNPDDSRVIINQRIGVNSSINLATIPGKVLGALLAAFLLILPFSGILLDGVGRQEIDITYDAGLIEAHAGITTYTIGTDSIESVVLLDTLPDHLVRTNGTAFDTLLKGHFTSEETGPVRVILDPRCGPFLLIETGKGNYLLGTRDADVTRAIYSEISGG